MQCGIAPVGRNGLHETFLQKRLVAVESKFYYATVPIVTANSDTPANTYIPGLMRPVEIEKRLDKNSDGRFAGIMARGVSDLALINRDNELTVLATDYVFRDREVIYKAGETTRKHNGKEGAENYDNFEVMFKGIMTDLRFEREEIIIRVEDNTKKLDKSVQENTYLGGGGRTGTVEITGQRLPLCYGDCKNIKPVLVDSLRGIYQVHDGEVKQIENVRDRGIGLNYAKNVSTYEALVALTTQSENEETEEYDIGIGQFATCLNEGYFRLGGIGTLITADVRGDGLFDGFRPWDKKKTWKFSKKWKTAGLNTHRKNVGGIIYRILTTRAGYLSSEINIDLINQFDNLHPYEVCLFISSNENYTIKEVCNRLLDSVNAVLVLDRLNRVCIEPLTGPAPGQHLIIKRNSIVADSLRILPLPYGAPWSRIQIQYNINWSIFTEDQLSAEISTDEKAFYLRDANTKEFYDRELLVLYPDRPVLVIKSLLVNTTGADALFNRLKALYSPTAMLYQVAVYGIGFQLENLNTVKLTHELYNLTNGKRLLVVGITERPARNETELLLFG